MRKKKEFVGEKNFLKFFCCNGKQTNKADRATCKSRDMYKVSNVR